MYRLAFASAIALTACGTTADDRPANLDYITEAILAPSCGAASCHSSLRNQGPHGATYGYTFDSVEGARAAFQGDAYLVSPSVPDNPSSPPGLILNLTLEQPGAPRMPYYEPLPTLDVELIQRWLEQGAAGVCVGATACLGSQVVPCTSKGAYDLSQLTSPDGDCVFQGQKMNPPVTMTCRKGACVAL